MKTVSIAVVALAAALSLGACSSSSNETAATPAASASAPASAPAPVETVTPSQEAMTGGTLIDVASSTEGFATLTAALTAAGLAEGFKGEGPVTVFAPTDEAFAALPAGVLDALLLPENQELLIKILAYHLIEGNVLAADIVDGDVPTAEGQNVTLKTGEFVTVNGSKVIAADVVASNGVIHGIDAVLLPPDVDIDALLAN
ncbi:MAG: fasciclin domain-containing protein [Candidatus Nanopelagicales bacterium]